MTAVENFSLPLDTPLATARGTINRRDGFLLRVGGRTNDAVGLGEATPLPGWTESLEDCEAALREAANVLDSKGDWTDALAVCEDRSAPAARHAVELARADLDASRAGVPLYRHLGSERRVKSVPANATVGDANVDKTVTTAVDAVEDGFDCVKVKVGNRSVAADATRLRAVRESVGSSVEIRADANGSWDLESARDAFSSFAELDVAYVEQPLPAEELSGHSNLQKGSWGVNVALDETLATIPVDEVLAAGAADVLVLKPMALGGIERAHAAAIRAQELGVMPVVTTTVDAVVARTAAVHLAASLPNVPACGLATANRLADDLGPDPAPVVNGEMVVPQRNGLGLRNVSSDDA